MPEDSAGCSQQLDQDEVIVYSTMTVSNPPEDITDEWLADHADSADYAKAHHRVTGDMLAITGDEPASYVCPKCGEGTHRKREIDGTAYYYHYENEDCPLDLEDARERKREEDKPSSWKDVAGLASGFAITAIAAFAFIHVMPTGEMTINGESVTVPPSGPDLWLPMMFVLGVAFLVMLALKYAPGHVGRRGGY